MACRFLVAAFVFAVVALSPSSFAAQKAPPKPKGERPEAAPTLPVDPPKPAAPKPRTEKVEVVALEAESPAEQRGSRGDDRKRAASGGSVLGSDFGGRVGDFAEYGFEIEAPIATARISVRYARDLPGHGDLEVSVDGKSRGLLRYGPTGGWGDAPDHFEWASLDIGKLEAGAHRLRLSVLRPRLDREFPPIEIRPSPILDLAGGRDDKTSVGHGKNLALYTGRPSRFLWATYDLGNIFSAADGGTLRWYPDQVIVSPESGGGEQTNVNLDQIVITKSPVAQGARPVASPPRSEVTEQRQVGITRDDVVVSAIHLHNPSDAEVEHTIDVTGDITGSRDWRGEPGGEKVSRKSGDFVLLVDRNPYPGIIDELAIAVGGREPPTSLITRAAGTYELTYRVKLPPGESRTIVLACSVDRSVDAAQKKLIDVLADPDPLATIRNDWERFYESSVPRFVSSDPRLDELWAFRWFLLRFSTAGGGLGYFEEPVVLEGRQAYRTLCCYSAPFHALDLAWAVDPDWGSGHLASLAKAADDDGKLPWYTSPATNRVPIHHRSGTGLSLAPYAAYRHFLVHGRRGDVEKLWPPLARNVDWWVKDRDPDGDGLFAIDHQLETGMDDLLRWPDPRLPYFAVDATSYFAANARAIARLAAALGAEKEAKKYEALAEKSADAIRKRLWDASSSAFRDRHPETNAFAESVFITTFYPFFAGVAEKEHLPVIEEWLLSPERFFTAHPVPALPRSDRDYDPRSFWQGPSWPAATSHVIEGLAYAAKTLDRALLPSAAEVFRRSVRKHLEPRPDFYERYHPETGEPLSSFRDYMHSWWIDIIVRHVAGFEPREDGGFTIDALPIGLDHFALLGAPYRGRRVDVIYESREGREGAVASRGLPVRVDGKVVVSEADFVPGEKVVTIPAEKTR